MLVDKYQNFDDQIKGKNYKIEQLERKYKEDTRLLKDEVMRLKNDIEIKEENFKKDREILLHYCEAETKVYK